MLVRTLTTGRVRLKRAPRGVVRYLAGGWSGETLPVQAFLVERPAGLCLFDTGQSAEAARPGYLPRWHPFLRLARFELEPGDEVGAQLRASGVEPGRVRWVVLSHLHTDHVGGISPFADADILVSRIEWDQAQGLGGQIRGYLPQHWPPEARPRLVDPTGPPLGPFAWSLDLAGDGSLVVVPTPGHTSGHLSLIARDGADGAFLGGDVAHSTDELRRKAPEVARFCEDEGLTVLLAHQESA